MKSRAAVAFAPGEPLKIVEIDVAPPKRGKFWSVLPTQGFATRMRSPSRAVTPKVCSPAF